MMGVGFEYSAWLVLPCFLVAVLFASVLYYRNRRDEFGASLRNLLFGMRFLFVFLLLLLLLGPSIETEKQDKIKPKCFICVDNSKSMLNSIDTSEFKEGLLYIEKQLEKNFAVEYFLFGDKILKNGYLNNFDFTDNASDYGSLFTSLPKGEKNAVVLLIGDGNYNKGANPLYEYANLAYPLYSVVVGDTAKYVDTYIERVLANKFTYKESIFPIRIDINTSEVHTKNTNSRLEIYNKNKLIWEKLINLDTTKTIIANIKALDLGLQEYKIVLEATKGENNTKNNFKNLYIEVLEGERNILILANKPHPDITAIKQSLSEIPYYNCDIFIGKNITPDIFKKKYSLVFLHDLPSKTNNLADVYELIKQIPKWYILDKTTDLKLLNRWNPNFDISNTMPSLNEATATISQDFPYFEIENKEILTKLPPLFSPFGSYSLKGGKSALDQVILGTNTDNPLLYFSLNAQNAPFAIFLGSGLWKWRMYNYMLNQDFSAFDNLIQKGLNLLADKKDSKLLDVETESFYTTASNIVLYANLYNKSYERRHGENIEISIKDSSGKEYKFNFKPNKESYMLDIASLPKGWYYFTAKIEDISDKGRFYVGELDLEASDSYADYDFLNNLSLTYNGSIVSTKDTDWAENISTQLLDRKDLKPIIRYTTIITPILNKFYILVFLLLLICIEYFIRKFNGSI